MELQAGDPGSELGRARRGGGPYGAKPLPPSFKTLGCAIRGKPKFRQIESVGSFWKFTHVLRIP